MVLTESLWVSSNSSCFQIKMALKTEQCICMLMCLSVDVIHFVLFQIIEMGKFLKRQATIYLSEYPVEGNLRYCKSREMLFLSGIPGLNVIF